MTGTVARTIPAMEDHRAGRRDLALAAVTIVGLFVIGYYFYELGVPGGLTESRLEAAASEQQVVSVERGYNIYQANCAQCHGANGEGGKGPALNRQDKLFAHLNPDYLNNILHVGGRYACGDPNSIMPIWANTGNPPGPLNYKQVEDVIAFIDAFAAGAILTLLASELLPSAHAEKNQLVGLATAAGFAVAAALTLNA